MKLRWFAVGLWLALLLEAFLLAPASTPDTTAMIWKMLALNTKGIEPWVFSIFNSLGIFPMLFTCLLLPEPTSQRVPAWPFVMGSFMLGAFALFPYFMFREPVTDSTSTPVSGWLRLFESKILAGVLLLGGVVLFAFGLWKGNISAYVRMWQMNQLVHIMSLDFLVLSLVCPWLIWQDWHRRGHFSLGLWLWCCVPILGGATYLLLRPKSSPPV